MFRLVAPFCALHRTLITWSVYLDDSWRAIKLRHHGLLL